MKKIVFGIIICILSTTMIFAAEKLSKLNSALMKDKVNINTVKKLIASGEDVNQKYYGYYPIERVKNNFELVKILIEAGAEGKEKYFANAIWNQYDDEIIQYFCENDLVDSNKYVRGFRNYFRDNGKSIEDICAKVKAITVGKLTNPMILSLVTPDKYDAVCEVLNRLKIDIPVCGMVKDDSHRTRGLYYNEAEIFIDRRSEAFKLITRIQDEVHRFAIEYHRSLRSKTQVKSVLDDIKGIGVVRRKALIKHFNDIEAIKAAQLAELKAVAGMDSKSAQSVYDFFHKA